MPHWSDPERGWIATANNRPAPEDFPYPLSGTWSEGLRARRIHQLIEARPLHAPDDFSLMHRDSMSLRAMRCLPHLLKVLASSQNARIHEAADHLHAWDYRMEPDRIGATIFEVFFARWVRAVADERFDNTTAALVAGGANGLSAGLLIDDPAGWFSAGQREVVILRAFSIALDWLTERMGLDLAQWNWGRLHLLMLPHILSGRGDLGTLLDQRAISVPGNMHTVCNTGLGANFEGRTGAGYRLIADLSSAPPVLWSVDAQSHSGNPGSPHYDDQLPTWSTGEYFELPLDRAAASRSAVSKLTLVPAAAGV
jgi:penicillin amidase